MVALSIVFSYGLQFCVPSEIAWARLEPWLRKRRQNRKNAKCSIDDNETSTVVSSIMTIATSLPRTSVTHEVELKQLEKPFEYAYYVMRAVMILITCKSCNIAALSSQLFCYKPGRILTF